MSKNTNNLSTSFTTGIEVRVDRLERSHNSLEARLINLTTLIRSHYNKIEAAGEKNDLTDIYTRLEKLEKNTERNNKYCEIESRVQKLEENPVCDFQKALEVTHEKIKHCMSELKESLRSKEKEIAEKFTAEINVFKQNFEINNRKVEVPKAPEKKQDEIENIIRELQERLDKRSETPVKGRRESFSILRNNSCKSSLGQKQVKKKCNSKRLKKVKFNN